GFLESVCYSDRCTVVFHRTTFGFMQVCKPEFVTCVYLPIFIKVITDNTSDTVIEAVHGRSSGSAVLFEQVHPIRFCTDSIADIRACSYKGSSTAQLSLNNSVKGNLHAKRLEFIGCFICF